MTGTRLQWIGIAVCLACLCPLACAVTTKPPRYKEGRPYGVTEGFIWRPTWWNYYRRAESFAHGEFWEDAVEDFHAALRLRAEDRRWARTYGMRFVDYFPNRELGIVHYRTGNNPDAIARLERSLGSEPSAKAEYFLNKARKALLEQTGADREPPQIYLSPHLAAPAGITRELSLLVEGTVRDDQYVSGISINGRAVPVFLARQEIAFAKEVPLNPGVNVVEIEATDLVGKRSTRTLSVLVDRAGPVLFLEPARVEDSPWGLSVVVRGEARDNVGLARLRVGGLPVEPLRGRVGRFEKRLTLPHGSEWIEIAAEDLAGNVTRGTVSLADRASPQGPAFRRVACLEGTVADAVVRSSVEAVQADPSAGPEPARLSLVLKDLPGTSFTVYYDSLYIEGHVTGQLPVRRIEVAGEQLLDRQGRTVFFSYLAALQKGENILRIRVEDTGGNQAGREVAVQRRTPRVSCLSERMRLALLHLRSDGCSPERAGKIADDLLVSLVRQERFQMLDRERLEDLLRERRLSLTRLADEKTALRMGRILNVEGAVLCAVWETAGSIEVLARVVDVETSEILLVRDAFSEGKDLEAVRTMMEGLAYKLRQGFPLLEGALLRREGKRFYTDIGGREGLFSQQKVLFFRPGPEIRHPLTEMYLGREEIMVGEGRIGEVHDAIAEVRPLKVSVPGGLLPTDFLVTK